MLPSHGRLFQPHPCIEITCETSVPYDNEPFCPEHALSTGQIVDGYSFRAVQENFQAVQDSLLDKMAKETPIRDYWKDFGRNHGRKVAFGAMVVGGGVLGYGLGLHCRSQTTLLKNIGARLNAMDSNMLNDFDQVFERLDEIETRIKDIVPVAGEYAFAAFDKK